MALSSRKDGVDRHTRCRSMGDSGHYESSLPPEPGSHLRVKIMGQTPIRNRLLEKKEPGKVVR